MHGNFTFEGDEASKFFQQKHGEEHTFQVTAELTSTSKDAFGMRAEFTIKKVGNIGENETEEEAGENVKQLIENQEGEIMSHPMARGISLGT